MSLSTHRLRLEILLVLTLTFGMSGVRSLLRLVDSLTRGPLNSQTTTLYQPSAASAWLDASLQLCSALVLVAWGCLGVFLLAGDRIFLARYRWRDWLPGAGLAALIGLPGLALYVGAVAFGFSKEVVPSALEGWWAPLVLLVWAFANAFGEEFIVVGWLQTRLEALGLSPWAVLACSAVLRGSYHLYQGISAGFGNIIMGLLFGFYFQRTRRVWPLVLAHFLIDAVAFVGYQAIGGLEIPRLR
ncbi:CPBP family intramembrane glutamic endopeptidase [Corynebacterium epidermidicanis]|uniref:CAAX protease self-immunity n=1 Tax=Corynebacterium epidermidicanis TaxID=1050174 RepID=A0A0G3GXE3_9CORY|nr:type II CAAX endopeptidase family protein [Corynebacterium epidermidicanis]AKK04178.1 CAAX protease self-immunity [Corynebacterium epidermidicanis]